MFKFWKICINMRKNIVFLYRSSSLLQTYQGHQRKANKIIKKKKKKERKITRKRKKKRKDLPRS